MVQRLNCQDELKTVTMFIIVHHLINIVYSFTLELNE